MTGERPGNAPAFLERMAATQLLSLLQYASSIPWQVGLALADDNDMPYIATAAAATARPNVIYGIIRSRVGEKLHTDPRL